MDECLFVRGTALVNGLGYGTPIVFQSEWFGQNTDRLMFEGVECELARLNDLLQSTQEQLEKLYREFEKTQLFDEAAIVLAQLALLQDQTIVESIKKNILESQCSVEKALFVAKQDIKRRFFQGSSHSKRTFELVEDIFIRILSEIKAYQTPQLLTKSVVDGGILVAEMLWPSRATELLQQGFSAIVTKKGGLMSHAALLARSKAIPFITNLQPKEWELVISAKELLVDGFSSHIFINPTSDIIEQRQALYQRETSLETVQRPRGEQELTTRDGRKISVFASVEYSETIDTDAFFCADGIGLFRSEYLIQEEGFFPPEEAQYQAFLHLVEAAKHKPVVIRAYDFSGDKQWVRMEDAACFFQKHPRSLSQLLASPSNFFPHIRAIVRAAYEGEVSIVFPMISSLDELLHCKKMTDAARLSVAKSDGHLPKVKVGAMVELPSIICQISYLLKEVDFISLGTNDLVQYCLAINRLGEISCDRSIYLHEGFLTLLRYIATECQLAAKPCVVCGEMASDPGMMMVLVGLGYTSFTLPLGQISSAQKVLSELSYTQAKQCVQKLFSLSTQQERFRCVSLWKNMHKEVEEFVLR